MIHDSNFIVGSEIGLLKSVVFGEKKFTNLSRLTEASRDNEICCMCWADDEQQQVCMGLSCGIVRTFDLESASYVGTARPDLKNNDEADRHTRLCGIHKHDGEFVTCSESGIVAVWDDFGSVRVEFKAGGNVSKMRQSRENKELIVTGGRENEVKVWSLEEPKVPLFKGKNIKHDSLNLRVPMLIRDVDFMPGGSKEIVSCTSLQQIHIYDTSSPQRKPVIEMKFGENPLMCVSPTNGNNQVIVANSVGRMALVDLRKKCVVASYKGISGSIRDVRCHANQPYVVSCGADRHLRVHDINTKALVQQTYLKTRLNCVLVRDSPLLRAEDGGSGDLDEKTVETSEDRDDDELWKDMDKINDQTGRKTKRLKTKT